MVATLFTLFTYSELTSVCVIFFEKRISTKDNE